MTILQTVGLPQMSIIMITTAVILFAIVDILRNEFTGSNKLVWILTVILLPGLGVVLYFLIGIKQKLKRSK